MISITLIFSPGFYLFCLGFAFQCTHNTKCFVRKLLRLRYQYGWITQKEREQKTEGAHSILQCYNPTENDKPRVSNHTYIKLTP